MGLVTEQRVEEALRFLAGTDEQCAEAKANQLRTEHMAKVAEALAFKALQIDGKLSIEACKQGARVEESVLAKWEEHFRAVSAYELLKARRERQALVVDLYRTESANRRVGNV